jgi:IS5 family transposase
MRDILPHQLRFTPTFSDHERAQELKEISDLLDTLPGVVRLVHQDALGGRTSSTGRPGMSADQVLRALVLKQMTGYSYENLAFHLGDSDAYRAFCRVSVFDSPKKSTLSENIGRVTPGTLEAINRLVLGVAKDERIETARKVRSDCTVVVSNIHAPTDSSLLRDTVRVLARLMGTAAEEFGVTFVDHTQRAKRRDLNIQYAKSKKERMPLYKNLLKVVRKTLGYAERIAREIQMTKSISTSLLGGLCVEELAKEMEHYVELGWRVVSQTERRVLNGETVPAKEKVVSIFEPHTDIIVKDRREVQYGHKICLTTGRSGLILDVEVLDGNPADSTLAETIIDRQIEIYGRPPRQAAYDGGFASKANVVAIKDKGVKDVAFKKKRGLEISEMVKSTWVYKQLTNFRAGIEGGISFLKRCFGLDRCTWRGLEHFKSYVWGSVVSVNLLLMARRRMAAAKSG